MEMLYLNNFRGFEDILVPISRMNFLVGENSTGKSSLLSLIYLLNTYSNFKYDPQFNFDNIVQLGSYKDICSKHSSKKILEIGKFSYNLSEDDFNDCFILSLRNKDGQPEIYSAAYYISKNISIYIKFEDENVYYHINNDLTVFNTNNEEVFKNLIIAWIEKYHQNSYWEKYEIEEYNIVNNNNKRFIIRDIISDSNKLTYNLFSNEIRISNSFTTNRISRKVIRNIPKNVSWVAPIRSKPQEIYVGVKTRNTPEGDHAFHLLKKLFDSSNTHNNEIISELNYFGIESGLFDSLTIGEFGESSSSSPFEVLIKLKKNTFNLAYVGYGVSQVLPIIIDTCYSNFDLWLIQQPEVHLHPRAQAAFGGLLFKLLIKKSKSSFFIETHSDFLIDRYRYLISKNEYKDSQVLFFEKTKKGNKVTSIKIDTDGNYSNIQPKNFREFFINESYQMLGL